KGLLGQFAYDYVDQNRKSLLDYKNFEEFNRSFTVSDEVYKRFVKYAHDKGIAKDDAGVAKSAQRIKVTLKAYIARQFWKGNGYFPVINSADRVVTKAVQILEKEK